MFVNVPFLLREAHRTCAVGIICICKCLVPCSTIKEYRIQLFLGMITRDDVVYVLAISKSGESNELFAVVQHCKRFDIHLVTLTQNPTSTLPKASIHSLLLPPLPEACGLGVAPTTSSTTTLAMGDALAVALCKSRGFTMSEFGVFHPGGSL
jgi:arabinose-5-phosphate isomerase